MAAEEVKDGGTRRRASLKHQVVAVEAEADAGGASHLEGVGRATLQPAMLVSSDPDWGGPLASAPSAEVPALDFKGLARTVGTGPSPVPSVSLATVRKESATKPLTGLDSGMGADDEDGADGCTPDFSGAGKAP
jgi:hypothetical protein